MPGYSIGDEVLSGWKIVRFIDEGAFGKVFEVQKPSHSTLSCALKVISVPPSQSMVGEALSQGMDEASVADYFHGIVDDFLREVDLLAQLAHPGVVSYMDHEVVPHDDGMGWDVLLRMELLEPLSARLRKGPLAQPEVVRLGVELADALAFCHAQGVIHRDVKPSNVFVDRVGRYKLGDFGVARTTQNTLGAFSRKGTEDYMAPELYRGEQYGAAVDVYALGMVLYQLLNANRLPFLPPAPAPVSFHDRADARARRLSGEDLPALDGCDATLLSIVRAACAPEAADRPSAAELRDALQAYGNGGAVPSGEFAFQKATTVPSARESVTPDPIGREKTVGAWDLKAPRVVGNDVPVQSRQLAAGEETSAVSHPSGRGAQTVGAWDSLDAARGGAADDGAGADTSKPARTSSPRAGAKPASEPEPVVLPAEAEPTKPAAKPSSKSQPAQADSQAAQKQIQGVEAKKPRSLSLRNIVIAAVAVLVVVAVGVFALGAPSGSSESSAGGSSAATSGSSESAAVSNYGAVPGVASSVKAKAFEDYTWEELSLIAKEISAADQSGGWEAARAVAMDYNLCNSDGTLDGSQTREVELPNGKLAHVRIIGFAHDRIYDADDKEHTSDDLKAGITFMFTEAVDAMDMRMMGQEFYSDWWMCGVEEWLNESFYNKLPGELRAIMVSAEKTADYKDYDLAYGSQYLWVPSVVEVFGELGDLYPDLYDSDFLEAYRWEGNQYQLFEESGAEISDEIDGSVSIAMKHASSFIPDSPSWWLRTCYQNQPTFVVVHPDDSADDAANISWSKCLPNQANDIVPCFSI